MTPTPEQLAARIAGRIPRSFLDAVRLVGTDLRAYSEWYDKAAVAAGSTTDPTWAGPLATLQGAPAFAEYVAARAVPTALDAVPAAFHTRFARQTARPFGYWVGEAAPKPLTLLEFAQVLLSSTKTASIAVVTDELLRAANPATDEQLTRQLGGALATAINLGFLSDAAAAPNVPAGAFNGVAPIPSSGNVLEDVQALVAAASDAEIELDRASLVMSSASAVALAGSTASGVTTLDLRSRRGTYLGLPLILATEIGDNIALFDGARIFVASGSIEVDQSGVTALMMDDAPPGGPQTVVSMFQTNSTALRVEQFINWSVPAADGVWWIEGGGS